MTEVNKKYSEREMEINVQLAEMKLILSQIQNNISDFHTNIDKLDARVKKIENFQTKMVGILMVVSLIMPQIIKALAAVFSKGFGA